MSFRQGLQEVPDALARELDPGIRLRAPVTQVRYGPKGWTVGAAYQQAELYDGVVFAAPAHCADEIDFAFGRGAPQDPGKHHPSAGRGAGAGLPAGRVTHPLDGFGFLTPEVERRQVLGVIFSSTLFPGRAPEGHVVLTAFVGGSARP